MNRRSLLRNLGLACLLSLARFLPANMFSAWTVKPSGLSYQETIDQIHLQKTIEAIDGDPASQPVESWAAAPILAPLGLLLQRTRFRT